MTKFKINLENFKKLIEDETDYEVGAGRPGWHPIPTSVFPLTKEILENVKSKITGKKIVIHFTSSLSDNILEGEMIDRLLDCSEFEKGFFVPENYRFFLPNNLLGEDKLISGYIERSPGLGNKPFVDWNKK